MSLERSERERSSGIRVAQRFVPRWAVVALLLLSWGLGLTSLVQKSATMDEQNHIARGAAYLGTGDPRLSVEHPPLVNVLSALPAHLLLDLHLPLDQWWEAGEWYHFADNFLWQANQRADLIVFLARLPVMGLGLLLVSLIFRWGRDLFGPWGGTLAAAFCALDPNILAHQRLSTTDLGGTFFAVLAAYAFWCLSRRLTPGRLVVAGLALGLAFAAKLSALIFGPILALSFLLAGLAEREERVRRLSGRAAMAAVAVVFSLFVVWASYLFRLEPVEGLRWPVPAPPYIRGIRAVLNLAGGGRPGYLLGETSTEGWWYYFPVALIVKTPLPTLLGLILATVALARRPRSGDVFVAVPPLLFFAALTTARLNLGYRHLLPVLPFFALHIGRLAEPSVCWFRRRDPARLAALLLTAWLGVGTLVLYPHFLAFFNTIGGGPENGWQVLVDSNIDWGQDLIGLRRWMEQEGVDCVRLGWFGSAPPEAYGVRHELLPGLPHGYELWRDPPVDLDQPEPGVYAISVTNLVGAVLPDPALYSWFLGCEPDARIGYSVFIYRVEEGR